MTVEKIAVTLPPELVSAARRAVRQGRAASVSAYVAESMALRGREDTLRQLLDEMDAEYGPPSPEALAWADHVLGLDGGNPDDLPRVNRFP